MLVHNSDKNNVVLITGASSGIGKCLASLLSQRGYRVYGTSRKQPLMNMESRSNAAGHGMSRDNTTFDRGSTDSPDCGFIKMIQLDVCCDESVEQAVNYVIQQEGRIDILINNAGFGLAGAVEDVSHEEAYRQFDTNFFGVLRMCRKVIPIMREQKSGIIINISSVAAQFSIPFQSMYSASKGALELVTEAMRIELKPFGIKVCLVEPGDTRTSFTDNRQTAKAALQEDSAYGERFRKSVNAMIRDEINGPAPEGVAKVVLKLIKRKNPPIRKVVGIKYKVFVFLKRLLPSRIVEYLISKMY
ncbi:MAG TPA: SDR family oxidoreductase [Clostridiaceae bacterium]|nr:SDR family oxidoreductase [Clostridiaceae bacterium]